MLDSASGRRVSSGPVRTAAGLQLLAGAWLIIAPFVLSYLYTPQIVHSIVVGALVAALAAVRLVRPFRSVWFSWASALVGLWLMVSPWVFYDSAQAAWNNVTTGILVVALSIWCAVAAGTGTRSARAC